MWDKEFIVDIEFYQGGVKPLLGYKHHSVLQKWRLRVMKNLFVHLITY